MLEKGAATPGQVIAIDLSDARLETAPASSLDVTINNGTEDALTRVMELTGGLGADVAIEAVAVRETFEPCTELVRPGGRVANVGVHGHSATLHLEKLWTRDVTVTTGPADTFSRRDDVGLRHLRRSDGGARSQGRARSGAGDTRAGTREVGRMRLQLGSQTMYSGTYWPCSQNSGLSPIHRRRAFWHARRFRAKANRVRLRGVSFLLRSAPRPTCTASIAQWVWSR